jgi:hypothetical protein
MYEPPVPVTVKEGILPVKVKYVEGILRPPKSPLLDRPYEPKVVPLREGRKMVIRMAKKEEGPLLLEACKKMADLGISTDFFDLVAARVYAEILGWIRERVKDEYVQIGVIETGELAGLVNTRIWDEKRAISLHTLVFKRRVGAGDPLYLAKMEHAFDVLGVEEWQPTFESYYGFRMGCLKTAAQEHPWPEYQHELGGGRVFYNTKEQWERYIKPSNKNLLGTRPVPENLLKIAEKPKIPDIEKEFK